MADRRFWKNKFTQFRGLSLLEVIVAIAILMTILVSLSGIYNQGYRLLRKTRLNHMAYFLAQEKMEELMHPYIFDHLSAINSTESPMSAPYQDFSRQVNVTSPPEDADLSADPEFAYIAQVKVRVYWQGQSGEQEFVLSSYVFNVNAFK